MREAEQLLTTIETISRERHDFVFRRMYRNLFNRDLFLRSYLRMASNEGNMTKGTDGRTIDGFGLGMVDDIIAELRQERYRPMPVERTYIPKKDGRMRPLGIPTFRDKLVQEAVSELLNAVFEPVFSDRSHGFRPGRSCHTALKQIQLTCHGSVWAIELDISSFFTNIDHDILLDLVSEKIDDGRLRELLRRFLKAGYLEQGTLFDTPLGTPQGGCVSPILANIYLHPLDMFMEGLSEEYRKGDTRGRNPEYDRLKSKRRVALRNHRIEEARGLYREMLSIPSRDPMDPDFVRVHWCRYADDGRVFVVGSKALAMEILDRIAVFLRDRLGLELNRDKTRVVNLSHGRCEFLGFEIARVDAHDRVIEYSNGVRHRTNRDNLSLLMPRRALVDHLVGFRSGTKPVACKARTNMSVADIVRLYRSEYLGLYNYYSIASNVVSRMDEFGYFHYGSMRKTIATKMKCSVARLMERCSQPFPRKDGKGLRRDLVAYTKDGKPLRYHDVDVVRKEYVNCRSEHREHNPTLRRRILRNTCEVCGSTSRIEVHHVRNLSKTVERYIVKGRGLPSHVALMRSWGTKTLVLCRRCHGRLHAGHLEIPIEVLESRVPGNS